MFQLNTTKSNFFVDYYNTINGSIGLSNKEIIVLAALVEQYNIIRKKTTNEEIINELLFSSRHRTLAREKAGISEVNFNNYVSALKKKSVILDDKDNFRKLNPMIVPIIDIETDKQVLLTYDFILHEDAQNNTTDISGEENRNGESNNEISPFEFPDAPIQETSDTEEFEILLEKSDDAPELRDGDSTGEGDV